VDLAQTPQTLTYIIEESYEVVDAIRSGDHRHPEELGDLLLQVVLQAQIAAEEVSSAHGSCLRITQKLIRRHPHVFGDVKSKVMKCKTGSKSKPQKRRNHKHCKLLSAKLSRIARHCLQ